MTEFPKNHNHPPDMVETASETMRDISAWMAENPSIADGSAKEAKIFLDRGKLALKDLDDERDSKVRPLNEQVREINDFYRPAKEDLSSVVGLLSVRITQFITAERDRRKEITREAERVAAEAELRAREAERVERDIIESASNGELGVDVAASTQTANQAFRDFEKANRALAIAQKETKVKVGGGFTRAVSLKTKETLVLINALLAIQEMGVGPDVEESILKSARAYRKATGDLPEGVEARYTEAI